MARPAPQLPEPLPRSETFFDAEVTGWAGVINDLHFPFHDRKTIELFFAEARKLKASCVVLNGDILDCHELSRWDKTPDDPRYVTEVTMGREFLAYGRHRLPKARFIYKDGNHDERLYKYLARQAPALWGLDVLTLPSLLNFDDHGVEHVTDKKVIRVGKLNVLHGHEYPGQSSPVNPARGLFLRAKSVAMAGHNHQTSEHHEPDISGKPQAAWSVGCACDLTPKYMPLNKWNLGFAFVKVAADGTFEVRNLRVLNGRVV